LDWLKLNPRAIWKKNLHLSVAKETLRKRQQQRVRQHAESPAVEKRPEDALTPGCSPQTRISFAAVIVGRMGNVVVSAVEETRSNFSANLFLCPTFCISKELAELTEYAKIFGIHGVGSKGR
jgi:hypothetical protein